MRQPFERAAKPERLPIEGVPVSSTRSRENNMTTQFDMSRVSAQTLAAVNAATPLTREHGEAIARALMEGYDLVQEYEERIAKVAKLEELTAEAVALERKCSQIEAAHGREAAISKALWAKARTIWELINTIEMDAGDWQRLSADWIRGLAAANRHQAA
jgi:predicted RNase H-like nuclease (RuvC/YqgF family)